MIYNDQILSVERLNHFSVQSLVTEMLKIHNNRTETINEDSFSKSNHSYNLISFYVIITSRSCFRVNIHSIVA